MLTGWGWARWCLNPAVWSATAGTGLGLGEVVSKPRGLGCDRGYRVAGSEVGECGSDGLIPAWEKRRQDALRGSG